MSASPATTSPGRPAARLSTRLAFAIAVSSALAILVAFASFWIGWSEYLVAERVEELSGQLGAIAAAESARDEGRPLTSASQALLRVEAGLIGARLLVTDGRGRVERSSEQSSAVQSIDLGKLDPVAGSDARAATLIGDTDQVLVVAVPAAGRWIVAVERLSEVRAAQYGLSVLAAISVLLSVAVALLMGRWFSQRLTRPLVRLGEAAEGIAAGMVGTTVAEEGDFETVAVARSFNRMSRRVADALESQRAFSADVSHEVRTPLTAIRGYAEAIVDGTLEDPQAVRAAAGVIGTEAGRIESISQTLLALGELDSGAVALSARPVDIRLVEDALRVRFATQATQRGVQLVIALSACDPPCGDDDRVVQVLSALIANALAFVGDGGRVSVSAMTDDGRWRVLVDDDGPGIPADRRDLVFERFSKLDTSRKASSGGSGLGLTISRKLVELMGGSIWIEQSPLGGCRVIVELPMATS